MKKFLSCVLLLALLAALLVPAASAASAYDGKAVILVTGNIRGDIDKYPAIAAAKADYESRGARVFLLDGGGYLQGSAFANFDRGQSIYRLMDLTGYDAAGMNLYDFSYGDATTGYPFHGNFHKYYTQAELLNGAPELTYKAGVNPKPEGTPATRPAIGKASFEVVCSNLTCEEPGCYAFEPNALLDAGTLKIAVYVTVPENLDENLQDGLLDGYPAAVPQLVENGEYFDFCINGGAAIKKADYEVKLSPEDDFFCKAFVLDLETREVKPENVDLTGSDETVAAAVAEVREAAPKALGTSEVNLSGKDSVNRNGESNLGDFTADALLWYGQNKFEGFKKDVPLVAIQNAGNCDNFLYNGEITETDLLRALPFSPMGVGILYLTGQQLLETLEAGTQAPDCPGWPQVAGLKYTVHTYKPFDKGEEYGKFFKAKTLNRVEITEVGGKPFDSEATYAVIADNFLMKGNDTYYTFKEAQKAGAQYLNNGGGVKVRDIAAKYIKEVLEGKITDAYAAPQGRITLQDREIYVNPFRDVDDDAWYAGAVQYVNQNKLMMGTDTDVFDPEIPVSRAMLVTVLYRLKGKPEASAFENPFTDVPDDWYTDAVCWANHEKIAMGTDTGKFSPMDPLTREQAAAMLWRYSGKPEAKADLDFADAGLIDDYAQDAMTWAVAEGLLKGSVEDGKNLLNPLGNATRAEMATILQRFTTE